MDWTPKPIGRLKRLDAQNDWTPKLILMGRLKQCNARTDIDGTPKVDGTLKVTDGTPKVELSPKNYSNFKNPHQVNPRRGLIYF